MKVISLACVMTLYTIVPFEEVIKYFGDIIIDALVHKYASHVIINIINREYSSGKHRGLCVSFKWCTTCYSYQIVSELEQYFLDSFDMYSPTHGYNIYSMEKQKNSTMSIAMIYAIFLSFCKHTNTFTQFWIYIRYGSSRLIEHQFELPEI